MGNTITLFEIQYTKAANKFFVTHEDVRCDTLTRPIEAGASCSREATLSDITGYPRVPRGSYDL